MPLEFTEEQLKVIAHDPKKNGVVRAGPGTGKSMTVVALAQRLESAGKAKGVRFLTFTRAATSELAKKISATDGLTISPSTIHSFATSVLMRNQDALPTRLPLRIPTEYEIDNIIYPFISLKSGIKKNKVDKLVKLMSAMWESLDEENSEEFTLEERSKFNAAFQLASRTFGFTLLAQLPDLLRKMLSEQAEVKGIDLEFLIVDEYQDLNKCEIEVLKLLNEKGVTLLAVGDEDQSIYSFRHAHPAGIRNFESTFPSAEVYDLSVCHRSPQNLLDWAQYVILPSSGRAERPFPMSKSEKDAKLLLLHFPSEISEANGVAETIEYLISKVPPNEILVLTRTDSKERFTKLIKERLRNKNIPIFDKESYMSLLTDNQAITLFALLRILHNPKDSLAWFTLILETPKFGDKKIRLLLDAAQSNNLSFGEMVWHEIENGFPNLNHPIFKSLTASIQKILSAYQEQEKQDNVKWGSWIVNNAKQLLGISPSEDLAGLLLEVDKRIDDDNPKLGFFVSQIVPILKDIANEQQEGVRFMTMQSSKGLTARVTFVVGVDDDLIPRPEQDMDEERRLLYVAMTRSQEILIMTWANWRLGSQAHSGRSNVNRRNYSAFLQNGPVNSKDGNKFAAALKQKLNK